MEELKKMCVPLVEYLAKNNNNPYTHIVISLDGIRVIETTEYAPLKNASDQNN